MDSIDDPADTCHLLSLPDELLEVILRRVESGLNGPAHLTRLSLTCCTLQGRCGDAQLVCRCGLDRGQRVETLEQLAVLEALRNLVPEGNVKAVFMGADTEIRTGSLARLDELAALLRQHKQLTVSIDAHTGRNAPPNYAPHFTRARAWFVAMRLMEQDVPPQRIISTIGWGKDIAIAAGWQPGLESAIAELFFHLDGLTLPPRPSYYHGRSPPEVEEEEEEEEVIEHFALT